MSDNTTQPTPETLFEIEQIEKAVALSHLMGCDVDDVAVSDCDDMVFCADGEDYLVCTDDEAYDRAAEYIENSLWAFNASFIVDHSDMPYEAQEMITNFCADKCEDANSAVAAMITDMAEFIDDAICADGRGHFLNSYDGEEYEEDGFYIYQV